VQLSFCVSNKVDNRAERLRNPSSGDFAGTSFVSKVACDVLRERDRGTCKRAVHAFSLVRRSRQREREKRLLLRRLTCDERGDFFLVEVAVLKGKVGDRLRLCQLQLRLGDGCYGTHRLSKSGVIGDLTNCLLVG